MGEIRGGVTLSTKIVAFLPNGWTGLFPGSFKRVPVAVGKILLDIYRRVGFQEVGLSEKLTLLVDGLGDTAILSLVQVEDALVDAACRLFVRR